MKELDVLRGFKIPNQELKYRKLGPAEFESTTEAERIFMAEVLPLKMLNAGREDVMIRYIPTQSAVFTGLPESTNLAEEFMKDQGFKEDPHGR